MKYVKDKSFAGIAVFLIMLSGIFLFSSKAFATWAPYVAYGDDLTDADGVRALTIAFNNDERSEYIKFVGAVSNQPILNGYPLPRLLSGLVADYITPDLLFGVVPPGFACSHQLNLTNGTTDYTKIVANHFAEPFRPGTVQPFDQAFRQYIQRVRDNPQAIPIVYSSGQQDPWVQVALAENFFDLIAQRGGMIAGLFDGNGVNSCHGGNIAAMAEVRRLNITRIGGPYTQAMRNGGIFTHYPEGTVGWASSAFNQNWNPNTNQGYEIDSHFTRMKGLFEYIKTHGPFTDNPVIHLFNNPNIQVVARWLRYTNDPNNPIVYKTQDPLSPNNFKTSVFNVVHLEPLAGHFDEMEYEREVQAANARGSHQVRELSKVPMVGMRDFSETTQGTDVDMNPYYVRYDRSSQIIADPIVPSKNVYATNNVGVIIQGRPFNSINGGGVYAGVSQKDCGPNDWSRLEVAISRNYQEQSHSGKTRLALFPTDPDPLYPNQPRMRVKTWIEDQQSSVTSNAFPVEKVGNRLKYDLYVKVIRNQTTGNMEITVTVNGVVRHQFETPLPYDDNIFTHFTTVPSNPCKVNPGYVLHLNYLHGQHSDNDISIEKHRKDWNSPNPIDEICVIYAGDHVWQKLITYNNRETYYINGVLYTRNYALQNLISLVPHRLMGNEHMVKVCFEDGASPIPGGAPLLQRESLFVISRDNHVIDMTLIN